MKTKLELGEVHRPACDGLARIDAVVLLGVVLVLVAWLRPAAARTDSSSQALRCLSNHERLMGAWQRFAMDNRGQFPGNSADQGGSGAARNWIVGWLDETSNPANTNKLYLMNGQLGPYLDGAASVFKCPADLSRVRIGGRSYPRVRSVSMNSYVGVAVNSAFYVPGYRTYERMSQLVNPSPSRLWVIMDEREESINDCQLIVGMEGYDPFSPGAQRIIDYPAAYHNVAAGLSFADGHAELRRWRDPRTAPARKPGQLMPLNVPSPNNSDVTWLQARTSARLGR